MPRLPDSTALGERPTPRSRRPIVGENTGSAAAAVAGLGKTLTAIGSDVEQRQDRLQSAYAESSLLRAQIDAQSELEKDNDYPTYEQRYTAAMAKAQQQASGIIADPNQRALFQANSESAVTRGLAQVRNLAQAKEKDAGRASLDELLTTNSDAALRTPDEATRSRLLFATNDAIAGARDKGYISAEDATKTRTNFLEKYATTRAEMLPPADQIALLMKPGTTSAGGFDSAIQTVLSNEGGFVPVDGSSGAPAIYGINAKWHPAEYAKAKQIADADGEAAGKQYAQQFYKQNYWDKYGLDTLPPATQTVVMDGVVNHTSAFATKLVEAAKGGASPDELTALRKAEYQRLATQNPDKYAASLPGWEARLDRLATDSSSPAPATPSFEKTGTWVDFIPVDKRMDLIRKNQGVLRAQLADRVTDSAAMAASGQINPHPVSEDDFTLAYGGTEGQQKFDQYRQQHDLAANMYAVGDMTPAQQAALVESSKPEPGDDFAQNQKNYATLAQAVTEVNKQRNTDPIAFAQARWLAPAEPFDPSDAYGVAQRAAVARQMHDTYGTPLTPLTAGEAQQLSASLAQAPTDGKLAALKGLRDNFDDPAVYQAALQQIRPDSPVTAMAGMYLGLDKQLTTGTHWFKPDDTISADTVAARLVQGEALINPPKTDGKEDGSGKRFPMPGDAGAGGLRQTFDDYTGTAFRGLPKAADQAYQAYRAFYAAEASRRGDYSGVGNPEIAAIAAKSVVGTVARTNGKDVIAPWGMDETTFHDLAKLSFDRAAAAQGYSGVSFGDVALENSGEPNTYRAAAGAGYVLGKDRRPHTITLSRASASDATPPKQAGDPSTLGVTLAE